MPDLLPQERLQPSLLDRLRDDEPSSRVEAFGRWVLTTDDLRRSVQRDLEWLLNCPNLEGVTDLSQSPLARQSVINYGVPDLAGRTLSTTDVVRVQQQIRACIERYEPRLMPDSIRLQGIKRSDEMSANSLQFRIEARLWADPVPVYLLLRTAIDLDNGSAVVLEAEGEE